MTDPIAVPIGVCPCLGTPHGDGDIVYLRPKLGLEGGLAVEAAMASGTTQSEQTVAVSMALIQWNITGWTFTGEPDKKGEPTPVPVPPAPIQMDVLDALLPYAEGGEKIANKAAELYLEAVYGPLAARVSARSPSLPHNGATPPILAGHLPSRRKRSGSSSPRASVGKP